MVDEIVIDDEFCGIIPPLSVEEKKQLETNIVADGCRDPLVVWNVPPHILSEEFGVCKNCGEGYEEIATEEWTLADGRWECRCGYGIAPQQLILIDGHNRYEICNRLAIGFETVEMEFASRDEAMDWIDANQLGRRNLTPDQMSTLRGRRYIRAKKGHGGQIPGSLDQNEPSLSTAERLAKEHGVSPATIKRDAQFAESAEALGLERDILSGELDVTRSAVVEAAKPIIDAKREHDKWKRDAKKAPLTPPPEPPLPTGADIQKAKAHVSHNSGQNEWYTPPEFIEAARDVMRIIDLDPASSAIANKTVGASTFYSKDDDGLTKRWFGNVWINPPYAQPLISQFSEAVASKYEAGEIASAIALVNNATETNWFQRMLGVASAVCFPKSRIRFLDPEGNPGAPLQGQAIIYLGQSPKEFCERFAAFGFCLVQYRVN